ncbi:MAG: hypothetical protein NTV80_04050, partial [Verrucomicrobia bacterium]|nr:hypothetical protein [Verrucomicrobiota bacterium]
MKHHHPTRIPFKILSFLKLLPHACSGLHSIKSLRIASLAVIAFALSFVSTLRAAVQLPMEVTSYDATPTIKTATVSLINGAAVDSLYLRIHNLRFGGQVSVRLNQGNWVNLYNHTVDINGRELDQGGIGGINSTISLKIKLTAGQVTISGATTVSLRLNGTNGIVSAVRLIDLDFLSASGASLLGTNEVTLENPDTWVAPSN